MKLLTSILFLLLAAGCNIGIIVHDEIRAAELVADCLTAFKSSEGIKQAYEWTDDKFKEGMSFIEFSRIVSSVRNQNQRADIQLTGYEIIRSRETIAVYASSTIAEKSLYFKFTLTGTKHKDYYLYGFSLNDSEFDKNGTYRKYSRPIVVKGV